MERNIEMEGILAMLEEIKGNTEKPQIPGEVIEKLQDINEVCTWIISQKLVTETAFKEVFHYLFELLKESDTKQDEQLEKLRKNIIGHHQYVKEQIAIQQENTNARLERIENILKEQQAKQGILERFEQWIKSI